MSVNGQAPVMTKEDSTGRVKTRLVAVPNIALVSRGGGIAIPTEPKEVTLDRTAFLTIQEANSQNSSSSKLLAAERAAVQAAERAAKENIDQSVTKPQQPSEKVAWEYDVYATPFVPSQLKAVNFEEPGSVVKSRNRHWLNYAAYTTSFAGTSFLPTRLRIFPNFPDLELEVTGGDLRAESYFHQLTALWELECAAKAKENEGNALYKVSLRSFQGTNQEPLWILSVPGLRDDDPFLEKGDNLQLRQLWVDTANKLVQVPMQFTDRFGYTHLEERCWTGVQYDASIASVNRKQEIVYLQAEGLAPLFMGDPSNMVVNAIIPMKHNSLEAQRMALVKVSYELLQLGFSQREEGQRRTGSADDLAPHTVNNDWIQRILFPDPEHGLMQRCLRQIPHRELFDSAVNYEQAHAVNSICTNDYGTLPYLISGPPGTGKTKTLVEIAMNLLNTTEVAHILICAPSEAAADTLGQRLSAYLNTKQLLRLHRPKRADNEVPRDLLAFCFMADDMFTLPPFKTLMTYNVIVMSCQDAAMLEDARLTNKDLWTIERDTISAFRPEEPIPEPSLHWGALLVDEAAQATEIDVLPAISIVCPPPAYSTTLPQPLFIMAGDENQLGPRTASRNPQFATSLFSRLFSRPLYRDHPLSRTNTKPSAGPPVLKKSMLPIIYPPFTNLIRNYRSHPAILSVPSSLFYNDTLIPEAPTLTSPLQHSTLWRGKKWPVLFVPHTAHDEIERDGGGWYNVSEAKVACSIARQLVTESHVRQQDICIMSPFAAQVKRLRTLMQSSAYGSMWEVNIGPLEAFQGLESRVVIICTTRTRTRFLDADEKRGVGIVGQRRKMNVALTRAKEALVVVGNPEVLGRDEYWREWLGFCWRNGLVDGWDEGEKEDFGNMKIGVLERALISKEECMVKTMKKALGGGDATMDTSRDYEVWAESLREALEEECREGELDEDGDSGDEIDEEDVEGHVGV